MLGPDRECRQEKREALNEHLGHVRKGKHSGLSGAVDGSSEPRSILQIRLPRGSRGGWPTLVLPVLRCKTERIKGGPFGSRPPLARHKQPR